MRNAYLEPPKVTRKLGINLNPFDFVEDSIDFIGDTFDSLTGGGGNTDEQIDALTDAKEESDKLITEASENAARLIAQGQQAAAAATIEAAKIASDALLKATNASLKLRREFAGKANRVLQPTIKQGRFAMDEIASMLAIPNSKGQLVPFDVDKLTQLPAFETGIRAIENTAVGKKLSTQQAERAANFGADFFGQRVNQLQFPAGAGLNAENTLASGLFGTGAGLGATALAGGQGQANISLNQGNQLGDIFSQGAAQQAQIGLNTANNLSANVLGIAGAQQQLLANQQSRRDQAIQNLFGLGTLFALA